MLCKIERGGAWSYGARIISLPKSDKDLNALLQDMEINKSNDYAYTISNVKTGNDVLDEWFGKGYAINVDELNHIAGQISKLDYKELEQLGDIMKSERPDNTVDFINIIHNRDNYVIHENIVYAKLKTSH